MTVIAVAETIAAAEMLRKTFSVRSETISLLLLLLIYKRLKYGHPFILTLCYILKQLVSHRCASDARLEVPIARTI